MADGTGCSSMSSPSSANVGTDVARASSTQMRVSGGPGADLRKLGVGRWTLKCVVNVLRGNGTDVDGVSGIDELTFSEGAEATDDEVVER